MKCVASLEGEGALRELDFSENGSHSGGAMGPSRLKLDKPVIAAVAGGMELPSGVISG